MHGCKRTEVLLLLFEKLFDPITKFAFGDLHVVLGVTVVGHEGEKSVVRDVKLGLVS